MKCAVVIPVGPGQHDFFADACGSAERAWENNPGIFDAIEIIPIWDTTGAMSPSEQRNLGIDLAKQKGCEWTLLYGAQALLNVAAFEDHALFHEHFDAIWGNICENLIGSDQITIRADQIVATDRIEHILSCAPDVTLRVGHFMRTECADAVRFDTQNEAIAEYKHFLDLWSRYRCAKVPKLLTIERVVSITRASNVFQPGWSKEVADFVMAKCAEYDLVCDVAFEEKASRFQIDNPFDVIQYQHGRGEFFEIRELEILRELLGSGRTIVEVGANVGNHVVFYAQHMDAKKIYPFEPNPDAVRLLSRNIEINGLESVVDSRGIGIGAGARYGKHAVFLPQDNNLGAARLTEAGKGTLEVFTLDEKIGDEKVDFIKIDVEGMEFDVLEGASKVIDRDHPMLMIEVFRPKLDSFKSWCDKHGYRIEREFPYVNAVNFIAVAA